jgi:small GTP-binding protein
MRDIVRYPKVVVTGHFNSGKTELVRTVSEIPVVTTETKRTDGRIGEKSTTTVVMDFGRVTVDLDTIVYLFGTPGQERFDFMWEILSKNMLGFVVMVDSTNQDGILETGKIITYFKEISDVPYIIVANKQDLANATHPEKIRDVLGLSNEDQVVPCVATNPFQASAVIRAILAEIM